MNKFKKDKKQLSIFITAGFPELNSTGKQILELQSKGVDFIEVGIPFSDPMADGPTIQQSSEVALKNGMTLELLFEQLKAIKEEVKIPLVLMGYLNPVLAFGLEHFLAACQQVNVSTVIIPDLSFEIYQRFYQTTFEKHGVSLVFLVTPDTSEERISQIEQVSQNSFVYLVSSKKITGGQFKVTETLGKKYKKIRGLLKNTPLMMGFGISSLTDANKAQAYCDGAIIGSAYIKSIINQEDLFLTSNEVL